VTEACVAGHRGPLVLTTPAMRDFRLLRIVFTEATWVPLAVCLTYGNLRKHKRAAA
jgi:hypothetical protein